MKPAYFVSLCLLIAAPLFGQSNNVPVIKRQSGSVSSSATAQPSPKTQAKILDGYGKLPLSFEANQGQADARVKFFSRGNGYSLFLTQDEAVFTLGGGTAEKDSQQRLRRASLADSKLVRRDISRSRREAFEMNTSVLRLKLRDANPAAKVSGVDEMAGKANYFVGKDSAQWRTNVPTYAKVKYEGVYSGVDLLYYGNQRQLEYDFIVAPGADPHRIAFDIRGAKRIRHDANGDLVFKMGGGEVRWHKPVVYQEKNGTRELVAGSYAVTEKNRVGFVVGSYDASRRLYIDPVVNPLVYSTILSGDSQNNTTGAAIAVDSGGNAYVTGRTYSAVFPTTSGAFQTTCVGGKADCFTYHVFVTKFNPTGTGLLYSTYLGGNNYDSGHGIAVDSSGNAYVSGRSRHLEMSGEMLSPPL
jgi:hypothetical protein